MASEAAQAVASVAAEAAANAGAIAAEAVASAEANAEAAIAQANERVEAAQATAQAIADSAVQNAVVQEVHAAIEDLDEWEQGIESRIAGLESQASGLLEQVASLQARLTELASAPPTVVAVTTAEQPSILPTLAPEPEVTAVVVNPVTANPPSEGGDGLPVAENPASKRAQRKRWI